MAAPLPPPQPADLGDGADLFAAADEVTAPLPWEQQKTAEAAAAAAAGDAKPVPSACEEAGGACSYGDLAAFLSADSMRSDGLMPAPTEDDGGGGGSDDDDVVEETAEMRTAFRRLTQAVATEGTVEQPLSAATPGVPGGLLQPAAAAAAAAAA
eukprot:Rhum_TRINITY_DN9499_c0_g1::Rhum_TRINITY_DN9499_c0_g1_i1::g.33749::m.33749